MRNQTLPFLLCAVLAVPGAAAAQPSAATSQNETPPAHPFILLLDSTDGSKPREYHGDEMSISISRSSDRQGDPRADVSIGISTLHPIDKEMLQWSRQGEDAGASRGVEITIPATTGPSPAAELKYKLEGAKVTAVSMAYSSTSSGAQFMLQVSVRRITLNGIVMN